VEIYQLMMELMRSEERCAWQVRRSEAETADMLADRLREELATELSVSIYDTQRNDQAKRHRHMLVSITFSNNNNRRTVGRQVRPSGRSRQTCRVERACTAWSSYRPDNAAGTLHAR